MSAEVPLTDGAPIKILFLGANPSDTTRLALGREVREITQRLRATRHRDRFEVVQEWAVRVDDLSAALMWHRPQVVHFSGHGGPLAPGLLVEDASGKHVLLEARPLARLFELVGREVRCVVLNACSSAPQAEAIREHIDCVVGMSGAIRDTAAIAFAGAFYEALGFGESIETAFELGKNQVDLAGLVGADVPQLGVREGRDAAGIVLVGGGRLGPLGFADGGEEISRKDRQGGRKDRKEEEEVLAPFASSLAVFARNLALHEGPGGVPVSAVPHFLGRDDEMRELRGALATDSAVCVVATGLGGVGKTSLVRQFVATEAAAMFPDGSVWIDAMNLDGDVARVCERSGLRSERRPTLTEAAKFLAGALHEKRVLVVIDNVQDKTDVTSLPVVGGKSRTVLTSRLLALHESLGHEARPLLLGRWVEETCRAYLREVVPALASAPDKDLDALAMYVGRLPLAVRLLARLLMRANLTPERLLARLKQEPLGTLDKVATGADRGVAATFAASYEGLDDTQRRVLLALAACARVTTENVVARVVGLGDDVVGDVLADLAERSLVDPVEAMRWTMHDVVRLFVRAQPSIRQADEAHLAFAETHVDAHQDPLDWEAMEAGMAEVLAAVDRLLGADEAPRAARLVGRARAHLTRRGRYGELIERHDQLAARLPEGSEVLAAALGDLGSWYQTLGDPPGAIEHTQRTLAIHEQLGVLEGQAKSLGDLGSCYLDQGDIPRAIDHLRRALAIDEQLGRLEGQARDLGDLGNCYLKQGDLPEAIEHHQRALALEEKLGRLEGQARDLDAIGLCHRMQGDLPKAIDHLQRALALNLRLGRLEGEAIDLHNLGTCHEDQADLPRALDCYQRALALYRRIGLPDHHHRVREIVAALAALTAAPT